VKPLKTLTDKGLDKADMRNGDQETMEARLSAYDIALQNADGSARFSTFRKNAEDARKCMELATRRQTTTAAPFATRRLIEKGFGSVPVLAAAGNLQWTRRRYQENTSHGRTNRQARGRLARD